MVYGGILEMFSTLCDGIIALGFEIPALQGVELHLRWANPTLFRFYQMGILEPYGDEVHMDRL